MAKSAYAKAVDSIQSSLRPHLKENGFLVRGRTFNRTTSDSLTQVVNIQMGPSDPPGTTYVPGLTENLHGQFTVNLGVYVPEVARIHGGGEAKSWIQEHHCCVRSRLGEDWWQACADQAVIDDVIHNLKDGGLSFLERFSTRDKIIHEWTDRFKNMGASDPPQIVLAIILFERGDKQAAQKLLKKQVEFALETGHPGHSEYVRELSSTMGMIL